jgi:hypothetical protein
MARNQPMKMLKMVAPSRNHFMDNRVKLEASPRYQINQRLRFNDLSLFYCLLVSGKQIVSGFAQFSGIPINLLGQTIAV